MKELSFFFDFSSPFSYLAATQIEAVAARHAARVRYKPFLLGALFKSVGTPDVPLLQMSPPKQRHTAADLARWADYWGVPFRFPSRFPMNTIKPLRMVLQLDDDATRARLVPPLYRGYWVDDRDLSDDATLTELASAAGFDGPALVRGTQDAAVKAQLKAATDEAVAAGVFGAPTFVVGDQLFWGQDRLVFVEKALEGWHAPPLQFAGASPVAGE